MCISSHVSHGFAWFFFLHQNCFQTDALHNHGQYPRFCQHQGSRNFFKDLAPFFWRGPARRRERSTPRAGGMESERNLDINKLFIVRVWSPEEAAQASRACLIPGVFTARYSTGATWSGERCPHLSTVCAWNYVILQAPSNYSMVPWFYESDHRIALSGLSLPTALISSHRAEIARFIWGSTAHPSKPWQPATSVLPGKHSMICFSG